MDINADLGEGAGNDEQIMPLITSCNIACGGHFGDKSSIRQTIRLAQKHQVKVGAHWSYPDRQHFGRKEVDISTEKLSHSLSEQLNLFLQVCKEEGVKMNHIKAHGALYTSGSNREDQLEAMLRVLEDLDFKPKLYVQEDSLLHQQAAKHFPIALEAFIDRRYANGKGLVARSSPQALIQEPQEAWEQFQSIAFQQKVTDIHNQEHHLKADTLCIHGDQAAAVEILEYIHQQLSAHG